jgi:ankyrin repeat protein
LVAGGADINAKDIYGDTALHSLIKFGYWYYGEMTQTEFEEMIAQIWIANGADINAQDRYGRTPLHWAVSIWARDPHSSHFPLAAESVTEALIANGADINAKDHHGRTPLHVSVEYFPEGAATKVVNVLIDHGAQVNAKDNDGRTPLHLVIEGENIVGTLRSNDPSNSSLRNPFYSLRENDFALNREEGEEEIEIVFNGCSGSSSAPSSLQVAQAPSGWWTSRVELASLLLTHGARVNARDRSNQTPLELATRICRSNVVSPQTKVTELVELLKRYGAREGKDD